MSSLVEPSLPLVLLQSPRAQGVPFGVRLVNQRDLLRPRPFLQLRFTSQSRMHMSVMLLEHELRTAVCRRKVRAGALAVLGDPASHTVCHADVQDRVVSIGDDVYPKVVITRHD